MNNIAFLSTVNSETQIGTAMWLGTLNDFKDDEWNPILSTAYTYLPNEKKEVALKLNVVINTHARQVRRTQAHWQRHRQCPCSPSQKSQLLLLPENSRFAECSHFVLS